MLELPRDAGTMLQKYLLDLHFAAALLAALIIGGMALHIRRINRRLAASEKRYHMVFDTAPLGFIVSDRQQRILDWNQAAENIFGWAKAEALGRNMYELLVPPSDLEQVMELVGATLHEGAPTHSKNHNITRDGHIICCEWRNAPYFDAQGDIQGIISLGMDITERETLERNLHLAKDKAEQLLADQRQFVAMISHEFRSPLAVIDSASQVLELQCDTGCAPTTVIRRIRRGVRRLANFLENCLTEDRLDTRGWVLKRESIALDEFLLTVLDQARLAAPGHILELQNAAPGIHLSADPHLLGILLQNLLDNAIKYSPAGSRIDLRSQQEALGLSLSVGDKGVGITLEDREHILEKYYRGKNAGHISGAGLGLSLVARIVALHGGELSIDSAPGVGTRVSVLLPITES